MTKNELLIRASVLARKLNEICYSSNSNASPVEQEKVIKEVEDFENKHSIDLSEMMGEYEEEYSDAAIFFYIFKPRHLKINNENLLKRFERFVEDPFHEDDIDYWNEEIDEITMLMPFKDVAEKRQWVELGSSWIGEDEWIQMGREIISRKESRNEKR